jgi:hypothetical protein
VLLLRGKVPPLPGRLKRGGPDDDNDEERNTEGGHSDAIAFIIVSDIKRLRASNESSGRVK